MRARKNEIRSSQGIRQSARAIPGSPIRRMSRGARAQKLDPPVSRQQAARAGNTRFAHNKDVAGRAARAHKNPIGLSQGGMRRAWAIPDSPIPRGSRGARAQKPGLWSQGSQAACTSNTRFAHNKNVARCAARARHSQICPSQGGRRRARAIPGSPTTRMSRARKNQIRPSQGSKWRARAIAGSTIKRMSRGARAQIPDLPVSRRQAARASNSRCAHNKDAARRVAHTQKPDLPVSRRHAACAEKTGSPIPSTSRVVRAQKAAPPVSTRQRARAGITRFAHNKGPGQGARAKARSTRLKAAGGAQAIPGLPITRNSRGAHAQKLYPPVSRRPAARAGNTRFAHNKDVARRAARRGLRAQKPDLPVSRRQAACTEKTGSPIPRTSRVVPAQKTAPPVSTRQSARADNTRFAHNKGAGRGARAKA